MSVALATMDSAYSLSKLDTTTSHHHHHLLHLHHRRSHTRDEQQEPSDTGSGTHLRFSVDNILRPDFGRDAILNTRSSSSTKTTPIKVTPLAIHSPLGLPRDLSLASSPTHSTHCGLASPLQSNSSNLSRSGSLESLSSNRSWATNSLAAQSRGAESVSGESISSSESSRGWPASVASVTSSGVESDCGGSSVSGRRSSSSESTSGDLTSSSASSGYESDSVKNASGNTFFPAWIYCTRYSDRPSSGPRTRRVKRTNRGKSEEKRPRTAYTPEQIARLVHEFNENTYLNEYRRQNLSKELGLDEQQIKIWFQNRRAKIKKARGQKNPLALQLQAQGLYDHSTVPVDEDGEMLLQ